MEGGDLEGGRDESRNANVAALKKLFYQEEESACKAANDGILLRNLPLARFQIVCLPHQQMVFNIFQPALVHLFETLLATPEPWLFCTVRLPGGVDNLSDPDYALPGLAIDGTDAPGPKTTLQGTLCQVVAMRRLPDARLQLITHGLRRALVVRGTQALPCPRGDVLPLPDSESISAAARHCRRCTKQATPKDAILAHATAEDRCWQQYEFAPIEISQYSPPAFASFQPEALIACARRAELLLQFDVEVDSAGEDALLRDTLLEESICAAAEMKVAAVLSEALETEAVALLAGEGEIEATEAEAEAIEAETLRSVEVQAWLELDALYRAIAVKRPDGALLAPAQLIALLPPPPEPAGWPAEFLLLKVQRQMREKAAAQRAGGMLSARADPDPYIPYSVELYPARRRAQRLSFAIWALIRQENSDLQQVLELTSTTDRLRLAVRRIRDLRDNLSEEREP